MWCPRVCIRNGSPPGSERRWNGNKQDGSMQESRRNGMSSVVVSPVCGPRGGGGEWCPSLSGLPLVFGPVSGEAVVCALGSIVAGVVLIASKHHHPHSYDS